MMTPFRPKTPMQMRLAAERRSRPASAPRAEIDPASRPPLGDLSGDEIDAAIDWLAYLAAGRIQVR